MMDAFIVHERRKKHNRKKKKSQAEHRLLRLTWIQLTLFMAFSMRPKPGMKAIMQERTASTPR